ncbi:universal stress protein [Legionella taurinensis]|uniref:Universal stress protein n=1 Tax=Legionella taurinensis TaxID=70611 RepID=A0A3A5LD54_9GAMM|nr:universal stress protein [Legionella taurinensis]MDX1836883.1 universal stress protein [Legionella taurinensis]PUT41297.1 universal stress protein UspA [Legionella taurinensis]PUT42422.1 universal stress protein UspA [Legionella taurinensis]PUT46564.1 universal stress protein UspA [Legionella taurinensis]PUT47203.1 universal stress protein UspA [Legionella taurinensis]
MYATILHATDLKENHFAMCQKAAAIAKAFGGTLHLLHVIEPPASLQLAQGLGFAELANPVKDDAVTVMNVLGDALTIPVSQQHVEIGSIKQLVLKKVKELGCSLVIIGSHTPGPLPAFLGSTAHAVVHHAPCDVLTLRI